MTVPRVEGDRRPGARQSAAPEGVFAMRVVRRSMLALGLAGIGVVATACPPPQTPPPPPPPAPVWTAHHAGGPAVSGVTQQAGVIGTTEGWYGEVTLQTGDVEASPVVSLFPRTEPDGNALGAPEVLAPSVPVSTLGPGLLSDHVLLVGSGGMGGWNGQFFRESGGEWAPAGLFGLGLGETPKVLTDTMLVVSVGGGPTASLKVYDLPSTRDVVPVLAQTLTAPTGWGPNAEQSFGARVAAEGDVLVAGAIDTVGRVGIYRRISGQFALEHVLSGPNAYGQSVAVDDLGATERVAIGALDAPNPGHVEVYRSSGSLGTTWTLEANLTQPATLADNDAGRNFGDRVALDGSLLVVGERTVSIAPGPGNTPRATFASSVFHLATSAGWAYEASLEPLTVPLDTDGLNRGMPSVIVARNHVVGTNVVSLPTPGCTFFCFAARTEAWRFDRTPA